MKRRKRNNDVEGGRLIEGGRETEKRGLIEDEQYSVCVVSITT